MTIDITSYLKQASELEASIDRQTKVIENTNKQLKREQPSMRSFPRPSQPIRESLQESPPEIKKPNIMQKRELLVASAFCFIVGSIVVASGVYEGLWGLVIGIVFFSLASEDYKKQKQQYENYTKQKQQYELEVQKAEANYLEAMNRYNQEVAEYDKMVEEENERFQKSKIGYRAAQKALKMLELPFEETKNTLQQLYDLDIIFPKYRNMVAICTMYEYFASGRCTELTGPDGAYNLFESELRQNIIIGELNTIIKQLEQIKSNQYILYTELKKTNKILTDISEDMNALLNTTKEIAESAKITAFCSQVTAQNTEAIKYISLVNG